MTKELLEELKEITPGDVERVTADAEYRERLYKEFQLKR